MMPTEPTAAETEAARLARVELNLAILGDRQNRYDQAQVQILGKLDGISRDLGTWREMQGEAFISRREANDALSRGEKQRNELWEAVHRNEASITAMNAAAEARANALGARIDAGRMWLIGALGAAISALVLALLNHPTILHP